MESKINEFILYDVSKRLINIKTYIQKDYIVLELESDTGKFSKEYKLDQLKNIERYFSQSNDLEIALADLNDLFEEKYTIEEKDEIIILKITYKRREIKFILDKKMKT